MFQTLENAWENLSNKNVKEFLNYIENVKSVIIRNNEAPRRHNT